jgi:hypothetical protein
MIFGNGIGSDGLEARESTCLFAQGLQNCGQLRENLSNIMFFANKKLSLQTNFSTK